MVRLLKLILAAATVYPLVALALTVFMVASAVMVSAPVVVPPTRVTVATPLKSVSTEPEVGLKVAKVAVKVTTAPTTGLPFSSTTVAFTVPGLSTEMDVVLAPELSVNAREMLG